MLTYGFRSARDVYAKAQRDAEALRREVTSDNVFTFVVTAYHIEDWARKDSSINWPRGMTLESIKNSGDHQVCRDLANASKHFGLDSKRNPNPSVTQATSSQGYGMGRYGKGASGSGEESVILKLNDGSELNILDLAERILNLWKPVFGQPAGDVAVPPL